MNFREQYVNLLPREDRLAFLEDIFHLTEDEIKNMSEEDIVKFLAKNLNDEDIDFIVWEILECDRLSSLLLSMGHITPCRKRPESSRTCEQCIELCQRLWNDEEIPQERMSDKVKEFVMESFNLRDVITLKREGLETKIEFIDGSKVTII